MATLPPPGKQPKNGINIYGTVAVNPYKVTILCEELGIPYNYISLDISNQEHKSDWFTQINPNGRLPAIVHRKEDGTSVQVWESAACMLYLASEFDKENKISFPFGTADYWQMVAWLSWQVSGLGPTLGQACHFVRYASEEVPYGARRYIAESRRLLHVLETHLTKSEHPFVAGPCLTIADIAIFIWAESAAWCGLDIDEYPAVKTWRDGLGQRPAFKKGITVPAEYPFGDGKYLKSKDGEWYKAISKSGSTMIKKATDEWANI